MKIVEFHTGTGPINDDGDWRCWFVLEGDFPGAEAAFVVNPDRSRRAYFELPETFPTTALAMLVSWNGLPGLAALLRAVWEDETAHMRIHRDAVEAEELREATEE